MSETSLPTSSVLRASAPSFTPGAASFPVSPPPPPAPVPSSAPAIPVAAQTSSPPAQQSSSSTLPGSQATGLNGYSAQGARGPPGNGARIPRGRSQHVPRSRQGAPIPRGQSLHARQNGGAFGVYTQSAHATAAQEGYRTRQAAKQYAAKKRAQALASGAATDLTPEQLLAAATAAENEEKAKQAAQVAQAVTSHAQVDTQTLHQISQQTVQHQKQESYQQRNQGQNQNKAASPGQNVFPKKQSKGGKNNLGRNRHNNGGNNQGTQQSPQYLHQQKQHQAKTITKDQQYVEENLAQVSVVEDPASPISHTASPTTASSKFGQRRNTRNNEYQSNPQSPRARVSQPQRYCNVNGVVRTNTPDQRELDANMGISLENTPNPKNGSAPTLSPAISNVSEGYQDDDPGVVPSANGHAVPNGEIGTMPRSASLSITSGSSFGVRPRDPHSAPMLEVSRIEQCSVDIGAFASPSYSSPALPSFNEEQPISRPIRGLTRRASVCAGAKVSAPSSGKWCQECAGIGLHIAALLAELERHREEEGGPRFSDASHDKSKKGWKYMAQSVLGDKSKSSSERARLQQENAVLNETVKFLYKKIEALDRVQGQQFKPPASAPPPSYR